MQSIMNRKVIDRIDRKRIFSLSSYKNQFKEPFEEYYTFRTNNGNNINLLKTLQLKQKNKQQIVDHFSTLTRFKVPLKFIQLAKPKTITIRSKQLQNLSKTQRVKQNKSLNRTLIEFPKANSLRKYNSLDMDQTSRQLQGFSHNMNRNNRVLGQNIVGNTINGSHLGVMSTYDILQVKVRQDIKKQEQKQQLIQSFTHNIATFTQLPSIIQPPSILLLQPPISKPRKSSISSSQHSTFQFMDKDLIRRFKKLMGQIKKEQANNGKEYQQYHKELIANNLGKGKVRHRKVRVVDAWQ